MKKTPALPPIRVIDEGVPAWLAIAAVIMVWLAWVTWLCSAVWLGLSQ